MISGAVLAAAMTAGCGASAQETTAAQAPAAAEESTAGSGNTNTEADKTDKAESTAEAEEGSAAAEDGAADTETTVEKRTVYVTPQWVRDVLDDKVPGYEDAVIAEVEYGAQADAAAYNEAHIPGALYVGDIEVEDATGSEEGAYNLLPAEEVEKNLLSHGITKDTPVILYGPDVAGTARVAYAYLWAGVEDVKILNGGLDAWNAAGYETETTANEGTPASDFGTEVPAHPEYWTSIEDARDKLENDSNFRLVSIRSEGEWLGETSGYNYMDKAGEPEGAVWGKGADSATDVNGFCDVNGDVKTVKNLDGFKEVWKDADFTLDNELAFYCGTGWRAAVPFLVLYENGYDNISVYDGGWYEWLMHEDYPVQVGDPKSADCVHTTVGELPTGKAAK